MDTMLGFVRAMANAGKPMMVFDWEKAARLIMERGAKNASAGLAGDWEWTGGEIWADAIAKEGGRPHGNDVGHNAELSRRPSGLSARTPC